MMETYQMLLKDYSEGKRKEVIAAKLHICSRYLRYILKAERIPHLELAVNLADLLEIPREVFITAYWNARSTKNGNNS